MTRIGINPWARVGVYAFLLFAAAFFLLPLYVMLTTSFKSMDEIRLGQLFALPSAPSFDAYRALFAHTTEVASFPRTSTVDGPTLRILKINR